MKVNPAAVSLPDEKADLMFYILHTTARCNLRCSYCYVNHDDIDMTVETARAVVDLAEMCAKRAGLFFFGGEPLLMKELIYETVAYANERKRNCSYFFKITTNGLLLDDEFIDFARRESILISLSLDGLKESHDAHRQDAEGHGCYDKVVSASQRLLSVKPYSQGLMTVLPDTVGLYAAGVDALFNLGFCYVATSLDYSADWREEHLPELTRQYEALADLYERKSLAEEKFFFGPFEEKIISYVNNRNLCHERCELGFHHASVGTDGTLYPCIQFVGNKTFNLGNVYDGVDETSRQAIYALGNQKKPGCDRCAIRARCNHACACINWQATGSINKVPPMLCAHERIVLPIVDSLAERLYKKGSMRFVQKHYDNFYSFD